MRECAEIAVRYAATHSRWREDQLVIDAIAKRVEQLSELARYRIPRARRSVYPQIPWVVIAGMRERLVHDYANLDERVLSDVIENDLPAVVRAIDTIVPG